VKKCDVRKSNFLVTFLMLLFSLFLIGEVNATIYYVAPNGNDSNSGSISAPFRTIQRAADIVNPGDMVIVKNGIYTDTDGDDSVVYMTRDGAAGNLITFRAENKWGAVLDGQNFTTNYGFVLSEAKYVKVQDFEIKNLVFGGVRAASSSANIYIYRNKIHDIGRIYIDPCVYEPGSHKAISVDNSSYPVTIDNNLIYTIGRLPGGAANCLGKEHYDYNQDHCVYISSGDVTFINNILYNCKSGWAIQAYPPPISNVTIVNNTFYGTNPERNGHILISGGQNWLIQNNIFHSPRKGAVEGSSSNSTKVVLRNNLVYNASITASENCDGIKWICSNNITGDPKFINLSSYDFHLQSASPAIDKGITFSGRTKDADGNSIVGAPDIGAYEAGGVSEDTTPPAPPPAIEVK